MTCRFIHRGDTCCSVAEESPVGRSLNGGNEDHHRRHKLHHHSLLACFCRCGQLRHNFESSRVESAAVAAKDCDCFMYAQSIMFFFFFWSYFSLSRVRLFANCRVTAAAAQEQEARKMLFFFYPPLRYAILPDVSHA